MARSQLLHDAARAAAGRTGNIRHDLAIFVQLLRSVGIAAPQSATGHALASLSLIQLDRPRDFKLALKCCLTSTVDEISVFETVFEPFWRPVTAESPPDALEQQNSGAEADSRGAGGTFTDFEPAPTRERPEHGGVAGLATYSRTPGQAGRAVARRRADIDEHARRLARVLGTVPGRRTRPAPRGSQVDLRGTLRDNLRFGEELLLLRYSRPHRTRPRLAVLCDVSSSMQAYTPLFVAFVHALTKLVRQVQAAVFNTELVMVTDLFRRSGLAASLTYLDHQQVALSGGTRIGHCLYAFLDALDRHFVRADTVALILSDGWDVGEIELLEQQMRRLRGQVSRVVWCDPHAAAAGYQPQVQGLQIALPYVDDYLDFSGVESLQPLITSLASPVHRRAPAARRT